VNAVHQPYRPVIEPRSIANSARSYALCVRRQILKTINRQTDREQVLDDNGDMPPAGLCDADAPYEPIKEVAVETFNFSIIPEVSLVSVTTFHTTETIIPVPSTLTVTVYRNNMTNTSTNGIEHTNNTTGVFNFTLAANTSTSFCLTTSATNASRMTVTSTAFYTGFGSAQLATPTSTASPYAILTLGSGNATGQGQSSFKPFEDSASAYGLIVWAIAVVFFLA